MKTAGLIAKKVGMTRMVDAEGVLTAVTLLQIEQQKVTKVLTAERDGYTGFQVGYNTKKEKALAKADVARLRKASVTENFASFKEFRADKVDHQVGHEFGVAVLEGVKAVDVTGITKGCGFSGAHKRWNSAHGRMSHGSRFHKSPGSLGMRSTPGRTFKNRHQPGQEGNTQVTIQNLDVLDIDAKNNVLAVRGSVPGHRDAFLVIRPSIKVKAAKKVSK